MYTGDLLTAPQRRPILRRMTRISVALGVVVAGIAVNYVGAQHHNNTVEALATLAWLAAAVWLVVHAVGRVRSKRP